MATPFQVSRAQEIWIVEQYAKLSTPDLSEHSGVLRSAKECSGVLKELRSAQLGILLHYPNHSFPGELQWLWKLTLIIYLTRLSCFNVKTNCFILKKMISLVRFKLISSLG